MATTEKMVTRQASTAHLRLSKNANIFAESRLVENSSG